MCVCVCVCVCVCEDGIYMHVGVRRCVSSVSVVVHEDIIFVHLTTCVHVSCECACEGIQTLPPTAAAPCFTNLKVSSNSAKLSDLKIDSSSK